MRQPTRAGQQLAEEVKRVFSEVEMDVGSLETRVAKATGTAPRITGSLNVSGSIISDGDYVFTSFVSVTDHGATGNGATDDTSAIEAALAAIPSDGGTLVFPAGTYLHGPVVVSKPVRIVYQPGAVSAPSFDTTSQERLWDVQAPDVTFEGFTVTSLTGTVSNNKYLIHANSSAHRMRVLRAHVSGVTMSDGNVGSSNLLVVHGVYINGAKRCRVEDCKIDFISGAAVFVKEGDGLVVRDCHITDTRWYSITLDEDTHEATIENNRIDGSDTNSRNWGGSINLMSQTNDDPNARIRVIGNYIEGVHNYGAAVRVLSCSDAVIDGNIVVDCTAGALAASTEVQYIGVDRRGTVIGAAENGPCRNLQICNNILRAGSGSHIGIYIKNQYVNSNEPHENIVVQGNVIDSASTSAAFEQGVSLHGFQAGLRNVIVSRNHIRVLTVSGSAVGGAVGIVSTDAEGLVEDVVITDNTIEDVNNAEITASQSFKLGVYVLGHCRNVRCRGNLIRNFRYGVRLGSSNVVSARDFKDNAFYGCLNDALYSTEPNGAMDLSLGTALPVTGVYAVGHVRQDVNATASASWGWVVTTAGGAMTGQWASGQTYVAGDWYRNASNRVYELITAGGGTTSVEPTHTTVGQRVTGADGYKWMCRSVTPARWAPIASTGAVAALP